jgi:hypothetical protein
LEPSQAALMKNLSGRTASTWLFIIKSYINFFNLVQNILSHVHYNVSKQAHNALSSLEVLEKVRQALTILLVVLFDQ